jgi:hypothetical protein
MPIPFDIGPVEIGSTTVQASAAAGAAVVGWAGDGSDLVRLDPIQLEGMRIAPAAAALDVHAPHGVRATARLEASTLGTPSPTLLLAELRTGWDAPDGYGGVGLGRLHVPLSSDRRYEVEGMALAFRPLLSQTGALPVHAPGFDGRIAWPERVSLAVGSVWTTPSSDRPYLWARLDLTPLGALPDHEDGDAEALKLGAGGAIAVQRSPLRGDDTWIAGDVTVAWRSIGVDVGWISRNHDGAVSDDQWVGAHSRVAPLPAETDLFFAGRLEWIDGIVVNETARTQATGRLSWRAHPPDSGFAGSGATDAWGAVYVEGTFSRELGPGLPAPETGDALVLDAERANDWLQVGVWTRW